MGNGARRHRPLESPMTTKQKESLRFLSLNSTVVLYLLAVFASIILHTQSRLNSATLTGVGIIIALGVLFEPGQPTGTRATAVFLIVVGILWSVLMYI